MSELTQKIMPDEKTVLKIKPRSGKSRYGEYRFIDYIESFVENPSEQFWVEEDIKAIKILPTLSDVPDSAVDVSESGNGSVWCWMENETMYIAGENGVWAPKDSSWLFAHYPKVEEIDAEYLYVTNVTDMSSMFYRCRCLKQLDVSHWDVTNVTNMRSMFYGCRSLEPLDVSSWDVTNVTDMSSMFKLCSNLKQLEISHWSVSNVTDMRSMFYGCRSLEQLDVSHWDVTNVTDMSSMFKRCRSLEQLEISSWDVTNVTDMSSMFKLCSNLKQLEISSWDVTNVTNMSSMFYECRIQNPLDITQNADSKVSRKDRLKIITKETFIPDLHRKDIHYISWTPISYLSMSGYSGLSYTDAIVKEFFREERSEVLFREIDRQHETGTLYPLVNITIMPGSQYPDEEIYQHFYDAVKACRMSKANKLIFDMRYYCYKNIHSNRIDNNEYIHMIDHCLVWQAFPQYKLPDDIQIYIIYTNPEELKYGYNNQYLDWKIASEEEINELELRKF